MQNFLSLLILAAAACSAPPPTPQVTSSAPELPAAPLRCANRFRYPGGDLRAAKPTGVPLHAFTLGSQGTTCGATVTEEWEGIDSTHSSCNCNPPDGSIAVGPSHVVAVTNTAIEIWNKTGTVLSGPSNLQTMMTPPSDPFPDFSDPGVLYDAAADRWIVYIMNYNAAETQSTLNVAVSTTNDPTGSWSLFPLAMPYLLDYPHAAINGTTLYATGNLFNGPTTFVNAYALAIDLTAMYAGTTPSVVAQNVGNNASGVLADTLAPAQNDSASGVMYYLSADNKPTGNSKISLFRWADPFGANTFTLQGGVTVAGYTLPPHPAEYFDGGWDQPQVTTNDSRELAAAYSSGTLYGAHSVGVLVTGGATAAAQWYQIGNLDGAPTLLQQGTNATADAYRWMPSLAVDGSGNVAMSYSYTNGGYVGTRFTARYASTANGKLLGESDLVDGASFNSNTTRWGDFGTMVFDGSAFWTIGEYENGTGHGGWDTHVSAVTLGTSASFDLAITPSWKDAVKGSNTTYTVATDVCNSYSGTISLSASGLPTGATASFSPTSVTAGSSSTMTFHPASTTPTAADILHVTGTGNGGSPVESSIEAIANVVPSDFTISVSPLTATVNRGSQVMFTATLSSVNGFVGSIYMWTDGSPGGVGSWATDPAVLALHGHSVTPVTDVWTLGVASNATPGVYNINIRGISASGNMDHAAVVQLTVN